MQDVDAAKGMEHFLEKSLSLAKKIRVQSKEASHLISELEKSSDYHALIIQKQTEYHKFKEESEKFAVSLRSFAQEFPELLDDFRKVIRVLLEEIKHTDYIAVHTFPKFNITFDEQAFAQEKKAGNLTKGEFTALEKDERKIIKEINEIVELELQVGRLLEEINETISKKNIVQLCNDVAADGTKIDKLHEIVVWWIETKNKLHGLKKTTLKAIEFDEKAFKKLVKIEKAEKRHGLKEKKLSMIIGILGIAGDLSLNIIPGGGIISAAMSSYKVVKLYKESMKALQEAE